MADIAVELKTEYEKLQKTTYEADINYHIFGQVQRPWGYEIRAAIFDDDNNHVGSACMTWPKEAGVPSQEDVATKVAAQMAAYKEKRDNPPEPPEETKVISETDAVDFLVKRGYLEKGQKLEDLPDLTPMTVEKPLWRSVWDFLNKPLWGG